MNELLWKALHKLAGASPPGQTPSTADQAHPMAGVRISLNPSGRERDDLALRGYYRARTYLAMPSPASPRWLFPLDSGGSMRAGLGIYKPYARRARLLQSLLKACVLAHCHDLAPNRLVVASQGTLGLEDLVHGVLGDANPVFSMSLGTEARYRKLTVQVMNRHGDIEGYIKLPMTEQAAERVRCEGDTLERLACFPALRPHIPRVLYSGQWNGEPVLFQTPGPSRPGPFHLDLQCAEFLQLLWSSHQIPRPGLTVWEEVAAQWRQASPSLEPNWRALGEAALATARRELTRAEIPCGVGHGDFAPWNTRVGDSGLYVFDWESARWDVPALWDIFHFVTQASAHLKQNDIPTCWHRSSGERASFLLYLVSSACRLASEDSPTCQEGIDCRRQLVAKLLEANG